MPAIMGKIIVALFAAAGVLEFFRIIMYWLLKTGNSGKLFLVVSIKGHDEEAEMVLRGAVERAKWLESGGAQVVCLDCGMEDETRRICEIVCRETGKVKIYTPEEIGKIIGR
jgi:hypothetical protein